MQRKPVSQTATGTDLEEVHRLMIHILDKLFGRIGVDDAFAKLLFILLGMVEQYGKGGQPIASGPSGFLVVRLQVGG